MPVGSWECLKPVILYLRISRRFPIVSFWQEWSDFRNLYEPKIHLKPFSWSLNFLSIRVIHLAVLLPTITSSKALFLPLYSCPTFCNIFWCLLWASYSIYSIYFFISSDSLAFVLHFFLQCLCQLFKLLYLTFVTTFFKNLLLFPVEFSIKRACSFSANIDNSFLHLLI